MSKDSEGSLNKMYNQITKEEIEKIKSVLKNFIFDSIDKSKDNCIDREEFQFI